MWQHSFLLQVRVANERTTVRMKIKNVKYVLKLWAFRAFEKNLQLSNSGGTIFFEELKHKFSLNRFYFACEIPPHPHHTQRHTHISTHTHHFIRVNCLSALYFHLSAYNPLLLLKTCMTFDFFGLYYAKKIRALSDSDLI